MDHSTSVGYQRWEDPGETWEASTITVILRNTLRLQYRHNIDVRSYCQISSPDVSNPFAEVYRELFVDRRQRFVGQWADGAAINQREYCVLQLIGCY